MGVDATASASSASTRQSHNPALNLTLAAVGGILAFVAWDQSFWWLSVPDYRFGWLAPALVAYAIYRRWPAIRSGFAEIGRQAESGSATLPDTRAPEMLVWGSLMVAGVLFLFGAAARAYAGPSHPGSLAIAFGAGFMILAAVYLAPPRNGHENSPSTAAARLRLVFLFIYPAFIWLVTMPPLAAWEAWLSPLLLQWITQVVLGVFHSLGLPIELQGNVMVLRGGPVAVEEACLGLRSITGCLFGGLFLAEVCLVRWRSRALIVGAALALALAANFARVLFLNLWAHKFGPHAIEGLVHDSSGWAVLGLTAAGLLILTLRLERREAPAA